MSVQENREIENQISNLRESIVNIKDKILKTRHELILSLMAGRCVMPLHINPERMRISII